MKLFVVLFIVVMGSVFPAIIATSIGKVYYTEQAKRFERQIEWQATHYAQIAERNFELRRFKHDYNNMLIGVRELLREENATVALQVLSGGNEDSESSIELFETGNGIVDAILFEKQKAALAVGAILTFQGALATDAIAPTDLCVMFGNTIDNAIEACAKMSEGGPHAITVSCRSMGGFLFIKITNPVAQDIPVWKNTVKTSKGNSAEHGYGLYSLKKVVGKYHGTLKLTCENRIFSVDLELDFT